MTTPSISDIESSAQAFQTELDNRRAIASGVAVAGGAVVLTTAQPSDAALTSSTDPVADIVGMLQATAGVVGIAVALGVLVYGASMAFNTMRRAKG